MAHGWEDRIDGVLEELADQRVRAEKAEAEVTRLREQIGLLAHGLIDANRLDYPWKDGSRASRALDVARAALRGGE